MCVFYSYLHDSMICLNQITRSLSYVTVPERGHLTDRGWILWDCIFHSESRIKLAIRQSIARQVLKVGSISDVISLLALLVLILQDIVLLLLI